VCVCVCVCVRVCVKESDDMVAIWIFLNQIIQI